MIGLKRFRTRRVLFVFALIGTSAAAATGATVHRFAVTQTSGGGSLGSTEFLNTQSSGGAVQAQVGPSALTSLTYPFGLFGLYNSSQVGFGVVGLSTTAYGVAGQSTSNYASVFGLAGGTGVALEGMTPSNSSAEALLLQAQGSGEGAVIYAEGAGDGLFADAQAGGEAIVGEGDSSIGVEGDSSGTNSAGVYASSENGDGVHSAITNAQSAVAGLNQGSGVGVYGKSGTGYGSYSYSTQVSASPAPSDPPYEYAGAYAQSGEGDGVYGISGHNTGTAVGYGGGNGGRADLFSGVYASGGDGPGLYAFSNHDIGAYITNTGTYPTLYINNNGPGSADLIFAAKGAIETDSAVFDVDSSGDIYYAGTSTQAVARNPGTDEATYAAQQTEATVEDVGTAELVDGFASVAIAPDFAQTIDRSERYMVFLTPAGDNRGLYVASRSPAGFVVREAQGGRSSLSFDYRIVAHPYGGRLARLPHMREKMRLAKMQRSAVESGSAATNAIAPDPEARFQAKDAAHLANIAARHRRAVAGRKNHQLLFGASPVVPPNMFKLSAFRN